MTNVAAFVLAAIGFFGIGYEVSRGVDVLWEHWYCPAPIAMLFVAGAVWMVGARERRA